MVKELWQMKSRELLEQPAYFDSLFQAEAGRETKYPFFTSDMPFAAENAGEGTVRMALLFKHPLFVKSRQEASEILIGKDIYPSGNGRAGESSPTEKAIIEADERLGDAAREKGYDAIIAGAEVQVLDPSILPEPVRVVWDQEQGNFKVEDGSDWTDVSGHQRIVELALREGKPVPSEVLAEYPNPRSRAEKK